MTVCVTLAVACTPKNVNAGEGANTDDQTTVVKPEGRIVVSDNSNFLMYENGKPFFWLGDTAWMLVDKVTEENARYYLHTRAQQGFTVVQIAALGDEYGTYNANYLGLKAFLDDDYTIPNDAYFDHVERLIDIAAEEGLIVGFLPNWGDKICHLYGYGQVIFDTKEKAENYGKYIGARLKDKKNIIWILGGDRPAVGVDEGKAFDIRDIVRAQARGIAIGICGKENYDCCTMTYHPSGWQTSASWFHEDKWLDFNMEQNGHFFDNDVWDKIARDYAKMPHKPVIDGEPLYESLILKDLNNAVSTGLHVRRYMYHALFAGAFGHTYGCGGIWRMYDPDIEGSHDSFQQDGRVALSWKQSLDLVGAKQMVFGKNLILSRPYFTRIPDNSLVENLYSGHQRITATRDSNNTYIMVYTEQGKPIVVNTTSIGKGSVVDAWWFSPETGKSEYIGKVKKDKKSEFIPATNGIGNDWVLVIDDPAAGYPAPGSAVAKENL